LQFLTSLFLDMARSRSIAAGLTKLLGNSVAPIYVLDDERRILYCNEACAAWVGLESEELIGLQCSYHSSTTVVPGILAIANLCPPPQVFAGERLHAEVCGAIAGPSAKRTAEFIPLFSDSGEVTGVLTLVKAEAVNENVKESTESPDSLLHEAVRRFRQLQASRYRVDRLIGNTPAIVRARDQVAVAIDTSASVLITGPIGSGKDQVAQTIHYRGGDFRGNLLPLACASLGPDLLVSTLEAAVESHSRKAPNSSPSATLWLKDVDELPVEAQAEVARLLFAKTSGLRLLATSTKPVSHLMTAEGFRHDLACGLSSLTIELPALSDRLEDLPKLAQLFLEDSNIAAGNQVGSFAEESLNLLASYAWPGNLDELEAAVAEAHRAAQGPVVRPADLPRRIHFAAEATARSRKADDPVVLEEFLARVERELIERAMARAKGNKTRAAKLLGMTRPRLYRRLVQLKLV
jgi:DNA-binding NtrC family response regulator